MMLLLLLVVVGGVVTLPLIVFCVCSRVGDAVADVFVLVAIVFDVLWRRRQTR